MDMYYYNEKIQSGMIILYFLFFRKLDKMKKYLVRKILHVFQKDSYCKFSRRHLPMKVNLDDEKEF